MAFGHFKISFMPFYRYGIRVSPRWTLLYCITSDVGDGSAPGGGGGGGGHSTSQLDMGGGGVKT